MAEREFDIVLYGATGFVGGLTAEYLARNASDSLRWAIGGRSTAKLEAVRDRLVGINPALKDLPLIAADSDDHGSIERMVATTRVVLTTVGPYAKHGEPLVRACAESGTDYADLTGEPGFVDEMYLKYHERAVETGARLIHCAGFDSIPADLGAYFTILQLPEDAPIRVQSRVTASFSPSGGTLISALNAFGTAWYTLGNAYKRNKVESKPVGRRIGRTITPLGRDSGMDRWVSPLPTIDQFVVERSAAALDRYGPDFRYGHHYAARSLKTVVVGTAGITGLVAAAQLPPLRKVISRRIPPGTGPSPERRASAWFRIEFVGEGGGRRVRTAVSGGDGGYTDTAMMFSEVAFALIEDDLPDVAGSVTTVEAAGDALLKRLPKGGVTFEVVEESAV